MGWIVPIGAMVVFLAVMVAAKGDRSDALPF
jgi:hypothetical protein